MEESGENRVLSSVLKTRSRWQKKKIKMQTNLYSHTCPNPVGRSVDVPPYNHYLISGLQKRAGAHVHTVNNYITSYNLMWGYVNECKSVFNVNELLNYEAKLQAVYAGLVLNGSLSRIQP